jgi:uncharacterized protein YndB with AHSA1/START domain
MNFVVDKQNNKIKVTREFTAPLSKVWAAWTQSDLLDQWWAPKPWKANTKEMNFKEGGRWLYVMAGPEGEEHWCRADFKSISPKKSFNVSESFCDPNGIITNEFPIAYWDCRFSEALNKTIVDIEISYESLADLEKYIELGFQEGFTLALGNLDELFAAEEE